MTQLSAHFTLEELTITQVRGVDNKPNAIAADNLRQTAQRMETVRTLLDNKPISVTSGFRSKTVNAIVSGSITSSHMDGEAVDFICPTFGTPLEICRALEGKLDYDQLIFENRTWVHIGFRKPMRKEVLTVMGGKTTRGLPNVA